MNNRRLLLIAPVLLLLSACGGGGGDSSDDTTAADPGSSSSVTGDGRYQVTISGAQLESYVGIFGEATITQVQLLLDGEVIADRAYSPPTSTGFLGTFMNIPRGEGRHVIEFRIAGQTVNSSDYAVNPQGFVYVVDTKSQFTKTIVLSPGGLAPYTATLRTGESIRIPFDLP